MTTYLVGRLVELRTPQTSDYSALERVLNDRETMEALIPYFGVESWSDEMVKERYEKFQRAEDEGRGLTFAIITKSNGNVVGNCGFKNIDISAKSAEFGIILHRDTWGAGVSKECHLLCLTHGFEVLKLERIYFTTDDHNSRMKGFFKKHSIPFIKETAEGLYYELGVRSWPKVKESLGV